MNVHETLNLHFFDSQYRQYLNDPNSVGREWQIFFKGFDIGFQQSTAAIIPPKDIIDTRIDQLIHHYRDVGHLLACMDPLSFCPTSHPLLEPKKFGLGVGDMKNVFATPQFSFMQQATLETIIDLLKQTYCQAIGIEYMYLQNPDERIWIRNRIEPIRNRLRPDTEDRKRILEKLTQAALFEQVLNRKYQAVTRFSLEGGDALIPMLDALLVRLVRLGAQEVVLGMAHRGRLNVQANILNRPIEEILAEFELCYDASQLSGNGDVKYHTGYLANIDLEVGDQLQVLMVSNSSHLEAVNPVVEGVTRARQQLHNSDRYSKVVPLLIHGDAAFAGQGIVTETLNMSQLEGYRTGGTIHIVINNQIGYTTLPNEARSTHYATDIAKMLMVPIFHVHGENPEALVHVAMLAAEYRNTFGKDVVIDLVCYRRYGHNEGDEPSFTQPQMYDRIHLRPSLHILYAQELIKEGLLTTDGFTAMEAEVTKRLETIYAKMHGNSCNFPHSRFFVEWEGFHGHYSHDSFPTAVDDENLIDLARQLNTLPIDFTAHNKIKLLLSRRMEAVEKGNSIDWANAEALAFATLLEEGLPVRLSGQDCARGTFSQRHSILFDRQTNRIHVPLNNLQRQLAPFQVYNSPLSEAGVLAFEYGYAITEPLGLTIWEAQFGDFANNAQGIIDLFIISGETKWQRLCGLTLLLPHGWDGLGPEHSSARLERFLQLCAEENLQVCNLTTPAQYFHLLRRQAFVSFRKPLVVMAPKSLLRHPQAVSSLSDFSSGRFASVLGSELDAPDKIAKVLLCSGKIYYQLFQRCQDNDCRDIAIIRVEQLYPFPKDALQSLLDTYIHAKEWIWVQEEPENMGAWQFMQPQLEIITGRSIAYVGRPAAASPATGFAKNHVLQQAVLSDQAVGPIIEKQ